MTSSITSWINLRGCCLLGLAIAISITMSCPVQSQTPNAGSDEAENAQSVLTPQYLIGDAVSLSNKSYPEIEGAIKYFRNRDGKGAMEYLKRAKKKYPKLPPVNLMMAKMQTLTRNNQAVRLLLERTVIESPDDPETYLIVADQAYRANRTIEAEALFLMAEPKVKNFTENAKRKRNFEIRLLEGMAAVAERRAQWDKSYQLLTKMVEADPDNAVSHARLGLTLYRIEKPKEALMEFTKARELNPDMPHPYVSVAQLFSQEGDTEKARKAFERAYSEEKGNEKTAQAFAEWLILQNQLDEAQKVAKTLRENAPGSVSALLLDGIVAHMQGDSERAENALQKVLSLEPRHAQASDLLALLLIQRDNVKSKERALSYAELNAERFPNNAQANITKAWVQYKLGNKAEAQKSLEQGSRSGQMRADSMYLIAEIMVAEGQKQKAIAALQQGTAQRSGLFVFRREAEALLEKLKSEADSSSESGN